MNGSGFRFNPENIAPFSTQTADAINNMISAILAGDTDCQTKFREVWLSPAAQKLAGEINEVMETLITDMREVFTMVNDKIGATVKNYIMQEETSHQWKDFAFGAAKFNIEIEDKFSDGSVGVKAGTTPNDIATPVNDMKAKIDTELENLMGTAANVNPVVEPKEISEAVVTAYQKIKERFDEALTTITDSLATRLQGEDTARTEASITNASNLNM